MYSQAGFIRGARWTKWLYNVRPAVKKSLWNCNYGLDYPSRLVHLDFNQQTLRFDIVHLRDDYLRVGWRFLVIPLRRLLCYHLLPFLYLVDLVLQLYLLSVKCKYFVSGYFIFTHNLQLQLFNTWTNCVSSHLSLAVNCNQLLTAAIWLQFLSSVVIKEQLLDWVCTWLLWMNQIACPVFAYFNKSIFKPNRQMYLSTDLVVYSHKSAHFLLLLQMPKPFSRVVDPVRAVFQTISEYVVLDQFYNPNLGIFVDVENQLFALENSDCEIIRSYY